MSALYGANASASDDMFICQCRALYRELRKGACGDDTSTLSYYFSCASGQSKLPVQPLKRDSKISACSTESILALMRANVHSGLNDSVLGGPEIRYFIFPREFDDHVLSVRMFHISLGGDGQLYAAWSTDMH